MASCYSGSRVLMALLAFVLCVGSSEAVAGACQNHLSATVEAKWRQDLGDFLPMEVTVPLLALGLCDNWEVGAFGVSASNAQGQSNAGIDLDFSMKGAIGTVVPMVNGGIASPTEVVNVSCEQVVDLGHAHVDGGIDLYSFHIGGGGPFEQIADGTISLCDDVRIVSGVSTTIEWPLHVEVSMVAGESFGDPNTTAARGTVKIEGVVGEQNVLIGPYMVESVTTIPEQLDVTIDEVISIPVLPGETSVEFDVEGTVHAQAVAKSAGLGGFISGASTIGVTLPNSLQFGNFTGIGGGPLPPGVLIYSATTGMVYASTSTTGIDDGSGLRASDTGQSINVRTLPRGRVAFDLRGLTFDVSSLRIFDVQGRAVKELHAQSGVGEVQWDGRNEFGARVASGVYWVRYSTAGVDRRQRFVIFK